MAASLESIRQEVESHEDAIVKVQQQAAKGDATDAEVQAAAVELVDKVCLALHKPAHRAGAARLYWGAF